jgi:1-deoxy-D-xylulose-5-phosphate synthase
VALQKLNVIMCLDRAGLVGSDGPTHHGAFDLAYMRCIPNIIIAAPRDEHELRNLMFTYQNNPCGPFVIRYPRGKGYLKNWKNEMQEVEIGKGVCLKSGEKMAVLSIGTMSQAALKAIEIVEKQTKSSVALYDMRFVKPLDEDILHETGKKFSRIVTIEDGVIQGGFGSAVLEFMSDNNYSSQVTRLGIPDKFIEHGAPGELYNLLGLDAENIAKKIIQILKEV